MALSIEQRLAALERQNRVQRRALALLVGALGVTVLATFGLARREQPPKEITAQSFTLADQTGRALATLAKSEDGALLQFLGENGKPRAFIGFNPKLGPRASLLDENGYARVALAVTPEGAGVKLRDSGGKDRLTLAQCPDCASLSITDEDGQGRAEVGYKLRQSYTRVMAPGEAGVVDLTSSKRSSGLTIRDPNRAERAALELRWDAVQLKLNDGKERHRAVVWTKDEESAVSLVGSDGESHVMVAQDPRSSGVFVAGPKESDRLTLSANDQIAGLRVWGKGPDPQLAACVTEDEPVLSVWNKDASLEADVFVKDNHAALAARDRNSDARTCISATPGSSELAVWDKAGNVRFWQPGGERQAGAPQVFVPRVSDKEPKTTPLNPDIERKSDDKLDLGPSTFTREKPR